MKQNMESKELTSSSLIELENNIVMKDASKREPWKRSKKKFSSADSEGKIKSTRKNRVVKLCNHRLERSDYSQNTSISTVLGDLSREFYSDIPIDEIISNSDSMIAENEFKLAPPPVKNISNRQYVEQKNNRKFSAYDLEYIDSDEYEHLRSNGDTPVKVAIVVQGSFRPIASLCCGLLGGLSLWQCLIMRQWSDIFSDSFVDYIIVYILPLQSLFYLLSTIAFVSALDSCGITNKNGRNFWFCYPCKKAPLLVAVVLMMTIFASLIGSPLDDQIVLSIHNNRSLTYNTTFPLVSLDIDWWVTMNATRCVCGLVAWGLFSLCLGPDTLKKYLISLLGLSKHNESAQRTNENDIISAKWPR